MTTDWNNWLAEQMGVEVAEVEAMDDATFAATLDEYQGLFADEMTFEQRLDCGRADAREITRHIGDQLAQRIGLLDSWSGQSEAVYLTDLSGRKIARVATHAAGGVSARAAGHEEALCDIRLGDHDETSTHSVPMPGNMDELGETIDRIETILREQVIRIGLS